MLQVTDTIVSALCNKPGRSFSSFGKYKIYSSSTARGDSHWAKCEIYSLTYLAGWHTLYRHTSELQCLKFCRTSKYVPGSVLGLQSRFQYGSPQKQPQARWNQQTEHQHSISEYLRKEGSLGSHATSFLRKHRNCHASISTNFIRATIW